MRLLRRHPAAVISVASLLAAAAALAGVWRSDAAPPRSGGAGAGSDVAITVGPSVTVRSVAPGFLGLSLEYWALENYAGKDPRSVDPVLVRLVRNLTRGGGTVLRIGGVTTDRTWWPVAGVYRPPGAFYTLTAQRIEVARALAKAVNAQLILGVQFEADSTVEAAAESRAMIKLIGRRRIAGLELGNEPELYGNRWFYKVNGQEVFGRASTWDFQSYVRDYAHIASSMGRVPLAGPAIGTYSWMSNLPQFLSTERLSVVTLHRYPLQSCGPKPGDPNYPTISNLLGQLASKGLADQLAPYVAMVHRHRLQVRNAEMNSVSCGDAHGVANTFAGALWALDALFQMVRIGVDGVNLHTYTGAADALFSITHTGPRWRAFVAPEYYGVLMFSQAAPAGARLLRVSESGRAAGTVRAWATRSRVGRIRVVLINDSQRRSALVAVHVPGAPRSGTLERLTAPGAAARDGVQIGHRSFGRSTSSGALHGLQTATLTPSSGAFLVRVPAASAALLTF